MGARRLIQGEAPSAIHEREGTTYCETLSFEDKALLTEGDYNNLDFSDYCTTTIIVNLRTPVRARIIYLNNNGKFGNKRILPFTLLLVYV